VQNLERDNETNGEFTHHMDYLDVVKDIISTLRIDIPGITSGEIDIPGDLLDYLVLKVSQYYKVEWSDTEYISTHDKVKLLFLFYSLQMKLDIENYDFSEIEEDDLPLELMKILKIELEEELHIVVDIKLADTFHISMDTIDILLFKKSIKNGDNKVIDIKRVKERYGIDGYKLLLELLPIAQHTDLINEKLSDSNYSKKGIIGYIVNSAIMPTNIDKDDYENIQYIFV
jgi:hypothetical protein